MKFRREFVVYETTAGERLYDVEIGDYLEAGRSRSFRPALIVHSIGPQFQFVSSATNGWYLLHLGRALRADEVETELEAEFVPLTEPE